MEQNSNTAIANINAKNMTQKVHNHHGLGGLPRKKKSGPIMHLLKVAMFMLRIKSGKSKSTQVVAASKWKKLLGSMRPLHVHSNHSLPCPLEAAPGQALPTTEQVIEQIEDLTNQQVVEQLEVFTPPLSPAQESTASSSCDRSSRYQSAVNLQELDGSDDDSDDEEEEDSYYDDKCGDEMIDAKAEEFIARFYEQMRVQHVAYTNRCNELNKKSIN